MESTILTSGIFLQQQMLWIPLCFFLIAFFYSMAGFGGGSSYLVVLILAGFHYRDVPSIALLCNLVVTVGGCWHFYRAGHLKIEKVLPFILLSIPMAYLGGLLPINKQLFCLLLGVSLFMVAWRLFMPIHFQEEKLEISPKRLWLFGVPVGALLGFLAGLVGIGGGIFLSPFLLLMRWAHAKEAAAAASFFIVVNSLSGLTAQLQRSDVHLEWFLPLGLVVFLGGQLGSRLGVYTLPKIRLQQLLGALVFYVSMKLLSGVVL